MLVKYSSCVPERLLKQVMGVVIEKIQSGDAFGQYDMLSVLTFVRALDDEVLKNSLLKS